MTRSAPGAGASRGRSSPIPPRPARRDRPPPRRLQRLAAHDRVGASEVDVLEDAERGALALDGDPRLDALLGQRDDLAGLDVAQQLGADDVERARLAGDAVAVAELAEDERPQPGRVAEGDDAVAAHDHGRE